MSFKKSTHKPAVGNASDGDILTTVVDWTRCNLSFTSKLKCRCRHRLTNKIWNSIVPRMSPYIEIKMIFFTIGGSYLTQQQLRIQDSMISPFGASTPKIHEIENNLVCGTVRSPPLYPPSHLQMIGLARPIYVPSGIVNKSEIDLKLPDFVTYSLRRSGDNICWQLKLFLHQTEYYKMKSKKMWIVSCCIDMAFILWYCPCYRVT